MTGDGYEVDPDALATRAAQFEPLATRLAAIHRELTTALAADGPCWGTDPVGSSFAAAHTPPADATAARLADLPSRLADTGTRLTTSATTYRSLETTAADHLKAAER